MTTLIAVMRDKQQLARPVDMHVGRRRVWSLFKTVFDLFSLEAGPRRDPALVELALLD